MKKSQIASVAAVTGLSLTLMGWGAVAGASEGEVMGVMTGENDASIVVVDQPDAKGEVVIAEVVAPADSFVVVHQSDGGMPGKRVGYALIEKGESTNVRVNLDPKVALTPELLAAVHADRGTRGELEFDMDNMERSPDRPYFVGGKEVATAFKAAEFGVPVKMDEASIEVGDQPLTDSVTIAKAIAPADAFVVVHKATPDGMPGERVGFEPIMAGENTNVKVELSKKLSGTTKLLAAVHADTDANGKLEFDMDNPVSSPDHPYFADGMEVAVAFKVGAFGIKTSRASLEASDQIGAEKTIVIDRVDAPADSWIVVHKDEGGTPGDRVGLARVRAGVTTDVEVELEAEMLPENLIVALHADKESEEVFDFDMMDKLGSADQPYFVDGEEVAAVIKVREFGYQTPDGTAAIKVANQAISKASLVVGQATTPEPAWVVVHLDGGGMPGGRVGLAAIGKGTTKNLRVQLDASQMLTETLFVAIHADRGESRVFEFNMMDRVNSADQPWFVGDAEVATAVTVQQ